MKRLIISTAIALALAGCAMHSGVMERHDGTFTVSAFAAPMRGGAAGARAYAFEQAQAHCAKEGKRAVLVEQPDDIVLLSNASAAASRSTLNANTTQVHGQSNSGGFSAPMAAGQSSIAFECR